MSKGIEVIITGTLSLLFSSLMGGYSQNGSGHSAKIMFYNVENLFDIFDDTISDDDEFLPDGIRTGDLQQTGTGTVVYGPGFWYVHPLEF